MKAAPLDDRRAADPRAGRPEPPAGDRLARVSCAVPVVLVVGFGSWTLAYQLALMVHLGVLPTCALALALAAVLWWLLRGGAPTLDQAGGAQRTTAEGPSRRTRLLGLGASVGTLAAVVSALAGQRVLPVVLLLLGSVTGLLALGVTRRTLPDTARPQPVAGPPAGRAHRGLWLTAWFWALATALMSMVAARPDGDDAYFVNLSAWVSERGTFPTRDTMFADQVFAAPSSHTPPVHSIEGLYGSVAHLLHLNAATLVYLVVPPVLTALTVLVLAYGLAVCRVPAAPAGLTAAVLYLLASGATGASYGNFFALRIWQGKGAMVSVFLPLLFILSVRFVREGGRRLTLLLVLGVVCAVGASNSAILLVPVLLVGLLPAAWHYGGVRRMLALLPALGYAMAGGVAMALAAPASGSSGVESASGAAHIAPVAAVVTAGADPISSVPGTGGLLVATGLAVGLGWLGLRLTAARYAVLGVLAAFAFVLLPPVMTVLVHATGASDVLWRMWWVVPVPLLVGGVVGAVAGIVPRRAFVASAAMVALLVGLTPLVHGMWIFSHRNGVRPVSPLDWKVPVNAEEKAALAARVSSPGDVVLAPWDTSRVLVTMTVRVHPVAPRTFYLAMLRGNPAGRAVERARLQAFADRRNTSARALAPMLDHLAVRTVCVVGSRRAAVSVLRHLGWHVVGTVDGLACLRR